MPANTTIAAPSILTAAASSPRCFKCKSDVAIIATREGPKKSYCVTCFTDFCNRTVRDALFRDCLLPPDMPVVLCVSGGVNSMAMLHLLGVLRQTNMTRGGSGKIFFDFRVLHLTEEDIVAPASQIDVSTIAAAITNFASAPAPVGGVAGAGSLVDPAGIVVKSMRSIFDEIAAETAGDAHRSPLPFASRGASATDLEEEYVIRKRIALSYAAKKYCSGPLLPSTRMEESSETATPSSHPTEPQPSLPTPPPVLMVLGDNAVISCTRALGDLVRGKGSQIPSSSALRSRVQGGAYAMRPLRGLLPKEIIMYCKLNAVPRFTTPTPTTAAGVFGGKSVNRLLQTFVSTLMQTFPSTPFNVLNSVTKLTPASAHNPHRLPTHLPNTRQMSMDTASVASGHSSNASNTSQVKVILTKASQANVNAVNAIAQEDRNHDQRFLAATCSICDIPCCPTDFSSTSSSAADHMDAGGIATTAASHSILRQVFGLPTSERSLQMCYGCSALCLGLRSTDGIDAVQDLLSVGARASHDVNEVRKLSRDEIESSIAEFLL
ncbi:Hypothetical protein, putative [Bodo saltans]|uniref:Cytoplasmic tRNA 2-thiolation protein 2 n=1 Tax=Bodo saltans TaxID=75058 RepID=A0A0S4JW18_BODSA|nr:Hypothetical protein, putative [Bodo saltans]|eukprot:CUG94419.1 Hypothetical protein, putative [Bodo saltans]